MSLRKFNSHHAKKVSSENTTEENSFLLKLINNS